MTKKIFPFILFLISNIINSQTLVPYYQTVVNQCSQTNITTNLTEYEALGVKRRGTVALDNTLNWLKAKYLSYGYTASQIQEDSYTYTGSTAVCKNLIVTKIGTLYPNIFVIIDGHYDSIAGTGTNDNGSGLACILEVARLLKDIPTEYSIKFINFSGEEDGLYGSKHYVTNIVNATTPKMNIRLVLNIDEVGGVAGMTNNTITCEKDNSSPTTNNAASATFTNQMIICVGLYTPLNTLLATAYASDYMSFQSNNEIITGLFETNETTHNHTATDLLINMDLVYNYNVAKVSIASMLHFAKASTTLESSTFDNPFQVTFFPNPVKDFLTINSGQIQDDYQFSMIDIQGKALISKTIVNPNQLEKIDISQLQKGMYLCVIEFNDQRITKKIVVE